MNDSDACENTDRELWRGPDEGGGNFYADSIFITKEGALGIACSGSVRVLPIREWHRLAGGPMRNVVAQRPLPESNISPAVQRAMAHFWIKATEYDHEKLRAIYNDMHELQDRVETIPLSQAIDAMDLALQIIDRLAPTLTSTGTITTEQLDDLQFGRKLHDRPVTPADRASPKPAADLRQIFSDGDNTHRWPRK
jgi:hypothetical protein